jgi:chemotaxis response regulator CheB
LNSGPLVPQTSALTRLRHAPSRLSLYPLPIPPDVTRSLRDTRSVPAGPVSDSIRVLLADERRLFASAVRSLLASHSRFELVAVAFDGEEAVRLAVALAPDVVVLDADLPEGNGLEATRLVCETSSPRMVILAGADPELDAVEAHDMGASAVLPRARSAAELVEMLEFTALLLDAADSLAARR